MRLRSWDRGCLSLWILAAGCAAPVGHEDAEGGEKVADYADGGVESVEGTSHALVDCSARSETGYRDGRAFSITVIEVDGKPVEIATANHYVAMQRAASRAGISLRISSGFRTMAEQRYFYDCYLTGACNGGNLAARPGYSNHQSGQALDLNTSMSGVLSWLNRNASAYGFERTVSSEPWHWEWTGGGAAVDVCGGSTGADGCTSTERNNCGKFGCGCVNHQCAGGWCDGSGCTRQEIENCGKFGCGCVDHQCSGGWCDGSGCTARETDNCAKFGTSCVDHECSGGWTDGSGCTARETDNCAKFGTSCVDHECSGGWTDGSGCTALEIDNCSKVGCDCVDHQCAGGFCPGTGCTALETDNCSKFGCNCASHQCTGGSCSSDS